ncbi:SH3 domain-containing protein [Pseudoroseomonas cervicalis]|uniref:SH3 domain-containing protein n=1 Tax=Teichococcus cervicalis TaxID=204525 RepID=UPI0022F18D65|nr:SH3 domain-containing protein [Pseudoroseomonas cervicalis]WBV44869.1 SH3 domain-containing protein [Pseudoroseomonas cervicalis]
MPKPPPPSRSFRRRLAALAAAPALAGALLLAGCDDPKPGEGAAAGAEDSPAREIARRAALEQVRARLRIQGEMRLRAIQVYRQQLPGAYAVCGQINPSGAANDPFIPWVVAVTLPEGGGETPRQASLAIGLSNIEASRVYLEMVERCFEGGGPRTSQGPGSAGLPPLPSDTALGTTPAGPIPGPVPSSAPPRGAAGATAAAPPPTAPGATPPETAPAETAPGGSAAGGSVTTTSAHPVNIRANPGGGGAVLRVVPRASPLRVFGEAPGGWLQVGEDQPFGWLHESMLER